MNFGFGFFDIGFGVFGVIFTILFVIIIGVFIVSVIMGIDTWNKNNHSPRLTVDAMVISKRTKVTQHNHPVAGDITGAHGYHTSSCTQYYVTFQVESGDRIEFCVSGTEYAMLAENDFGKLSFQGTRYLSFLRR